MLKAVLSSYKFVSELKKKVYEESKFLYKQSQMYENNFFGKTKEMK